VQRCLKSPSLCCRPGLRVARYQRNASGDVMPGLETKRIAPPVAPLFASRLVCTPCCVTFALSVFRHHESGTSFRSTPDARKGDRLWKIAADGLHSVLGFCFTLTPTLSHQVSSFVFSSQQRPETSHRKIPFSLESITTSTMQLRLAQGIPM